MITSSNIISKIKSNIIFYLKNDDINAAGSRTAARSKVEIFVAIVNGWKPLTLVIKSFISNVAAVLDPSLSQLMINIRAAK